MLVRTAPARSTAMKPMLRAFEKLPASYRLMQRMDLVRNRKLLKLITALSVVLAVLTVIWGILLMPDAPKAVWWMILLRVLAGIAAYAAYIVGHEAVHGVLMWLISRQKPAFGASLMYAYAGSKVFFGKAAYLLIAIAPLAFWTPVLCALAALVPPGWFWVVWAVQIGNISGAAGDLSMFLRVLKLPSSALIQDSGTAMNLYHCQL